MTKLVHKKAINKTGYFYSTTINIVGCQGLLQLGKTASQRGQFAVGLKKKLFGISVVCPIKVTIFFTYTHGIGGGMSTY